MEVPRLTENGQEDKSGQSYRGYHHDDLGPVLVCRPTVYLAFSGVHLN
jgi:hypothetical protein